MGDRKKTSTGIRDGTVDTFAFGLVGSVALARDPMFLLLNAQPFSCFFSASAHVDANLSGPPPPPFLRWHACVLDDLSVSSRRWEIHACDGDVSKRP
jgi:hypothetical protein